VNIGTHRAARTVVPRISDARDEAVRIDVADQRDFAAVRALIVEGLTQRWRQYDPSRNPDIEAFESYYGSALTVVARRAAAIVGCGTLIFEAPRVARIVRMSVADAHRRSGVGRAILQSLIEHAIRIGYAAIVLETSADWRSAVAFYDSCGFVRTHERDGDQHFRLDLSDHDS
jgi:GNAT superfamily N-acetyltransferase